MTSVVVFQLIDTDNPLNTEMYLIPEEKIDSSMKKSILNFLSSNTKLILDWWYNLDEKVKELYRVKTGMTITAKVEITSIVTLDLCNY